MVDIIDHINNKLSKNGWVHLSDISLDKSTVLAQNIGKIIYTTNVKYITNSKSLVTSNKKLELHTDHHKANYIFWYCVESTQNGGESILLDAHAIYYCLSVEFRNRLKSITLKEHKVFEDDSDSYPMVLEDANGLNIYYSFWLANENDKNDLAFMSFSKAVQEATPIEIKLKVGDVLIVNNHKILHGRRSFDLNESRHLIRYWISNQ